MHGNTQALSPKNSYFPHHAFAFDANLTPDSNKNVVLSTITNKMSFYCEIRKLIFDYCYGFLISELEHITPYVFHAKPF